jgi:uncharacterized protein YkwD
MNSFKKNRIVFFSLFFISIFQSVEAGDQRVILDQINHYRVAQGLQPLKLNNQISKEAETHSRNMAAKVIPLGHDGFKKRVNTLSNYFHHPVRAAENVAYNNKAPEIAVTQWLNSRGHRKNIQGNYDLTGIGIAYDKKGQVYVTQIFVNSQK